MPPYSLAPVRFILSLVVCASLFACRKSERTAVTSATAHPEGHATANTDGADDDTGVRYRIFPDERAALQYVLSTQPRIVGVGEVHQSTTSAPVRSAVEHFIGMIDLVAPVASDLVVEPWVQTGQCGVAEQAFARDVPRSTRRPAATSDHAHQLLTEAQRRGVAPHVLTLDCHDYARLTNDAGTVNLEQLALLLGRQLRQLTAQLYARRSQTDGGGGDRRAIWIYGGALHNDMTPPPGLESMSYAEELDNLAQGRYVELDLFVPEYIRGSAIDMEEPWYPLFERLAGPDHVLLIERGPRSFILFFRTGDRATPQASVDAGR
jgi:hypothetical protein